MNAPNNPFERWLGIRDKDPDHFRILGLSREETDKSRIREAAKRALAQIGEIPADGDRHGWKRVRHQIRIAYRCLSDEPQRQAYLASLLRPQREEDHPGSRNDQALPPHQDTDGQDTEGDLDTTQSLDTVVEQVVSEITEQPGDNSRSDPPASNRATLQPPAVPMATVVEEPPVAFKPPPAVTASGTTAAAVVVNTQRNSGANSKSSLRIMPWIVGCLVVAPVVTGGIIWFVNQSQDGLPNSKTASLPDEPLAQGQDKTPETDNPTSPAGKSQQPLPDEPDPIGDALKQVKPIVQLETNPVKPGKPLSQRKPGEPESQLARKKTAIGIPSNPGRDRGQQFNNHPSTSLPNSSRTPDPTSTQGQEPKVVWNETRSPTARERLRLAVCFDQAWKGVLRNDLDWSREKLAQAKSIAMSPIEQRTWELINHVVTQAEQFANSVRENGRRLRALDEIEVDNRVVAVIQADDNQLVYKYQGRRFAAAYRQIPPLLGIAIAARGQRIDSPQRQNYLALQYAIAAKRNPFLVDKAVAVLDHAERFQVNSQSYREFLNTDWTQLAANSVPSPLPTADDVKRAQMRLEPELIPASEIGMLNPQAAESKTQGLLTLALEKSNSADRLAVLETALQTAVQSRNAYFVIEVLDWKSRWFQPTENWVADFLAKLEPLTRLRLNPQDRERLLIGFLELAERCIDQGDDDEVAGVLKVAGRFAQSQGLSDWVERIQRKAELESDAAGPRLTL